MSSSPVLIPCPRRMARAFGDEDTGLFFTPIYALIFNAALTAVYVLVGEVTPRPCTRP